MRNCFVVTVAGLATIVSFSSAAPCSASQQSFIFPTDFTWKKSLPVTFDATGIEPFGGSETRALVFMDGSLYAGIGDWNDPELSDSSSKPAAQIARLDSPTGNWVQDRNFLDVVTKNGKNEYQAVAALGKAHFDHDMNGKAITPVDVLMAGLWLLNDGGLHVAEKTVTTGSVGAQGTWTADVLADGNDQVRAFRSYTDSVTGEELAFAGSYAIFSGGFDSTTQTIKWGGAESGSSAGARVMDFADCDGKLYATNYDALYVRRDGNSPSWTKIYQYSGDLAADFPGTSGFRGLACVPNTHGAGDMLIASLEGPGDIYDFSLDGSQVSIERNMITYLSNQGVSVNRVIVAYNKMILYPYSGTTACPDRLAGISSKTAFFVRHCDGTYSDLYDIHDPSITPQPQLGADRALVVSEFAGDPAGTIYAGGHDAGGPTTEPKHNTDWLYRGVPN